MKIGILGLRMIIVRGVKGSRSHGRRRACLVLYRRYGVGRRCLHRRQDEGLVYLLPELGAGIRHFLRLKRRANVFLFNFIWMENGTT